jgi:hypothetical protein
VHLDRADDLIDERESVGVRHGFGLALERRRRFTVAGHKHAVNDARLLHGAQYARSRSLRTGFAVTTSLPHPAARKASAGWIPLRSRADRRVAGVLAAAGNCARALSARLQGRSLPALSRPLWHRSTVCRDRRRPAVACAGRRQPAQLAALSTVVDDRLVRRGRCPPDPSVLSAGSVSAASRSPRRASGRAEHHGCVSHAERLG